MSIFNQFTAIVSRKKEEKYSDAWIFGCTLSFASYFLFYKIFLKIRSDDVMLNFKYIFTLLKKEEKYMWFCQHDVIFTVFSFLNSKN